eukprot:m.785671 g.785671  ORF g.785671 m.785671 type:complete len:779 (-) comp23302_c2_seq2:297-2633(-)
MNGRTTLVLLAVTIGALGQTTTWNIDCQHGLDHNVGTLSAPFKSVRRAVEAIRAQRLQSAEQSLYAQAGYFAAMDVHITGLCELDNPLRLTPPLDNNVSWIGDGNFTILSGGTQIFPQHSNVSDTIVVDLAAYNFSTSLLGTLTGRGYSGDSAAICTTAFEASAAELFYRTASGESGNMHLSRFPNRATESPQRSDWSKILFLKGTSLVLDGTLSPQLALWKDEITRSGSVWAHGLWTWNWADSHRPILDTVPENASVRVGDDDQHNRDVVPIRTGSGAQGGNVYVYNLLSELDAPGEYYIDRSKAVLHLRPPVAAAEPTNVCIWNVSVTRSDRPNAVWESLFVPGTSSSKFAFQGCSATAGAMGQNCAGPNKIAAGARLLLDTSTGKVVGEGVCCNDVTNSVASATPTNPCTPPFPHAAPPPPPPGSYHVSRLSSVIVARGVQGVSFRNMEIRYARGAGVVVDGSVNVTFVNTHIADHGMMGINVTGGSVCAVIDSEVSGTGDAGVVLDGGNRTTLEPSGHTVYNSSIHHNQRWILNYAPNVLLAGVGNSVKKSELWAAPQMAIFAQGNDHTVEDCDFHHLTQQCSDCGAFYMGRDWTYRGNLLLNNRWHSIASIWGQTNVVYLDDQLSSVNITGNVFDQTGPALLLGGGRDNVFANNVLNGSSTRVHMDARGGGGTHCMRACDMPYIFADAAAYASCMANKTSCRSAPAVVPFATSPVWARYPHLKNLLQDSPCTPKYNMLSGNTLCGGLSDIGVSSTQAAAWGSVVSNNQVVDTC